MPDKKNSVRRTPLDRIVRQVGSASELARLLGVSRQAVHQWQSGKRPIPKGHKEAIQVLLS